MSRKTLWAGLALSAMVASSPAFADDDAWFQPGKYDGRTVNIVVNASQLQPPFAPILEELKTSFEKASGARIVYNPLPENDLYKKVRLAIVGKTGAYDAMFTGAGGAKDFGLSGQIVPVPAAPDIADFFPGDVAQYSIDDKLYGAPLSSDTNILYWRKDLFEKAGLDPNAQHHRHRLRDRIPIEPVLLAAVQTIFPDDAKPVSGTVIVRAAPVAAAWPTASAASSKAAAR